MKVLCQSCGKTFSAPDDWLNSTVQCPKCHASVVARSADDPAAEAAEQLADIDEPTDPDELVLAPAIERPKKPSLVEPAAATPPRAAPATAAASKPQPNSSCPNCGARLPPDGMLCEKCGYHVIMKRVLQTELDDVTIDKTQGFERWLRGQLSEGESFTSLLVAFHATLAVFAVIIAYMFRPWSWPVLFVLTIVYAAVAAWTIKTRAYLRWADQLWSLLLTIKRKTGWRKLSPTMQPAKQFSSHSPEFGDEQLRAIEGLDQMEVLDLEGTSVTNQGLSILAGCQLLRYIVLRKTRVTNNGVCRLQLMLPKISIWI